MRLGRTIRVACIAGVLLLLPVQAAKACSCAFGDPRDAFAEADAAFVGTFLEKHLAEPPDPSGISSSGADTIYSFRLDEEYKGELGEPGDIVEVHSAFSGASCGLETREGEQYGLFLEQRKDGAWSSSLCRQTTPEEMREAASPLPAPTGEPPVRMLVGGSFGEAQVMGLDRRGRTVAYGYGGTDVYRMDVCPGGQRSLEIGQRYPDPPQLFVRDLATFEVVRQVSLPYGRRQKYPRHDPTALDCRNRLGRRVVIFSTAYGEPEAKSLVLEIEGRTGTVIHSGTARSATFVGPHLYLQEGRWGRDLVRLSLRTRAERSVIKLPPRFSSALVPSPDGDKLAGIASPPWDRMESEPTVFYTVDVSRRRATLRTRSLGTGEFYGYPGWMGPRRPAAFISSPTRSYVFDLRLRTVSRFGRWEAREPTVIGRTALGTNYGGALLKVRLPDGQIRKVRNLPSPVAYSIVEVP
ncbi:MAG: hypothetical protein M3N53_01540 [Actinomycetota bacterium]|nr:hypothetical protein [Actinomycetota bacterium]